MIRKVINIKTKKRLSKKAFADALEKGLGRAFIHVSNYGLKNVEDLVLNACLHDQNYDTQCESSREKWLFDMINDKPGYSDIRSSIIKALETETNDDDLYQLCGLAKEMALNGDREAKRILKKRVLKSAKTTEQEYWGFEDYIEVYGNSGLLDLAKIYGKRLLKDPEGEIPNGFYIDEEQENILIEHSKTNPEIKVYLDYLYKSGYFKLRNYKKLTASEIRVNRQKRRKEFRKKFPLKKIIEDARNGVGTIPVLYSRFGEYATERELEKICDLIFTETDEEVIMRLLWIFRLVSLPLYSPKYFKWANGKHEGLRSASIAALANTPDKKVHELAKAKVKACQILGADDEVLNLFILNYTSRDAKLIINALNSVKPNRDDVHSLTHSIRNLTEYYKDPKLADVLIWAYENNPCTICRERIVKKLYEFGKLSESILNECLYDAGEDIRKFANQIIDDKK